MSVPKDLRTLYIRSAPEKLATLERLWASAEADYWRPGTIQPLREFSHRLAGSGGSYGFAGLGDKARELELSLDDVDGPAAARTTPQRAYESLREELRTLAVTPID